MRTLRLRYVKVTFVVALLMGSSTLATSAQRDEMSVNILGLTGHLLIQPIESSFTDWMQVADRVAKVEGVRLVVPIVEGQALASTPPEASGVTIHGVRAADLSRMSLIIDHLQQGTLEAFDDSHGVTIGSALADRLSLRAGDNLTLTAPRGRPGTVPRTKQYRIVAVFEIGASTCGDTFIFMPLTEAQSYFDHTGEVSGIEVHITEADKITALRQRVTEAAERPVITTDWRQRNATCFDAK